ncbi:MAG: NlpC/P60 family protein [Deltaproteobacteria bacterium]
MGTSARKLAPALWLLLLFSASFGCASRADALGRGYARALTFELRSIINKHTPYAWGGSNDEREGLDCSGYIYLAARRAGLPVRRTTSRRMAIGDGGWTGIPVTLDDPANCGDTLDLMFWTFAAKRPNGHVGVRWGKQRVTHASTRRGVVIDRLSGVLMKALTKSIHLTIGE